MFAKKSSISSSSSSSPRAVARCPARPAASGAPSVVISSSSSPSSSSSSANPRICLRTLSYCLDAAAAVASHCFTSSQLLGVSNTPPLWIDAPASSLIFDPGIVCVLSHGTVCISYPMTADTPSVSLSLSTRFDDAGSAPPCRDLSHWFDLSLSPRITASWSYAARDTSRTASIWTTTARSSVVAAAPVDGSVGMGCVVDMSVSSQLWYTHSSKSASVRACPRGVSLSASSLNVAEMAAPRDRLIRAHIFLAAATSPILRLAIKGKSSEPQPTTTTEPAERDHIPHSRRSLPQPLHSHLWTE
eukprot:m.125290 g.125290  ORF g.125290 m.125290 type:complete len:302 (-) comp22118_c0_seq5:146-1051(-)